MTLEAIKQGAFRHFEKVLLIGVVAFVVLNAMGHMSEDDSSGAIPGMDTAVPAPIPSKAISPGYYITVDPYIDVPAISRAPYDIWWPPGVRRLAELRLQVKKKVAATIKVSEDEKIQGQPKQIDVPADWPLPDTKRNSDSVVKVTVAESGNEVTLEAVTEGRWVCYEVQLESGDRVRFAVAVDPADLVTRHIVLPPEDIEVKEKEFGVVHITFKAPDPREAEQVENVITIYHVPTHYIIERKGPDEEQPIAIGRIEPTGEATGAEGMLKPKPAPLGVPTGVPPGAGTPPGATQPGGEPVGGAKDGLLTFIDRSVDSEAAYSYTVYGVAEVPVDDEKAEKPSEKVPVNLKTKARFTFLFVGSAQNAARILVIVGPRDEPEGHKEYTVPIGGRVGELPHIRKAGEPLDDEVPDQRFVTGYVLVDMVSNAFRLVEQSRMVMEIDPVTGNQVPRQVVTYWARYDRYVILRDAKNRLTRIWVGRVPPELREPMAEKRPGTKKGPVPRKR